MRTAATPFSSQIQFDRIECIGARSGLVVVRPITPSDRSAFQAFVRSMSPESRYARFQSSLYELSGATLDVLTSVDHVSHIALVAHAAGDPALIAEARYVADEEGASAEISIAVADACQRQGLGTRLLAALIDAAHRAGVARLVGEVLRTNKAMRALAAKADFVVRQHPEARKVRITREIDAGWG
ncbi:MAG: N-acetyltransferase family protein [Burkholderiales bacterium]